MVTLQKMDYRRALEKISEHQCDQHLPEKILTGDAVPLIRMRTMAGVQTSMEEVSTRKFVVVIGIEIFEYSPILAGILDLSGNPNIAACIRLKLNAWLSILDSGFSAVAYLFCKLGITSLQSKSLLILWGTTGSSPCYSIRGPYSVIFVSKRIFINEVLARMITHGKVLIDLRCLLFSLVRS